MTLPYQVSTVAAVWALVVADVGAQCCCCSFPVNGQAVYEAQPVTQYRLEYETQYDEREITVHRQVWETQNETRTRRVSVPVVETRYQEYVVHRPVWETQTQTKQYTVRRPVTETEMRAQTFTSYEPTTVMRTQYVDQGQFVNQVQQNPGRIRKRLRFRQRTSYVDSVTGQQKFQRAGLYWVPSQGRGTTRVNRVWVPNVVAQQVQEKTYQAKQEVRQIPVQVTKYVDQVMTEEIPVQVLKWTKEPHRDPYQVTTYRYEEQTENVPIRVCKWVEEKKVVKVPRCVPRWVPVTVTRMVPRPVVRHEQLPDSSIKEDDTLQLSDDKWHSHEELSADLVMDEDAEPEQFSVLLLPADAKDVPEITSFPIIGDEQAVVHASHEEDE